MCKLLAFACGLRVLWVGMLLAKEIRKSFGSVKALCDVSLEVDAGDIVCLLGANGAGKSTMMNIFLGFLHPDSGSVSVCGIDPGKEAAKARAHIAYIPEHVALYEDMSGLENLAFFDSLTTKAKPKPALVELLLSVGLTKGQIERPVGTYSKGMRQKVGLAIAHGKEASVLLLDEPMSGLDPSAAREFTQRLNSLKEEGRAILMATHDIFRAKECATKIGIMAAGSLVDLVQPESMDASQIEQVYLEHMSREGRA